MNDGFKNRVLVSYSLGQLPENTLKILATPNKFVVWDDISIMPMFFGEPTHINGNLIDMVITSVSSLLSADHCGMDLLKPAPRRRIVTYRKLKQVDMAAFCSDLSQSELSETDGEPHLDAQVDVYNIVLKDLLCKHAPEKTRTVTNRPHIS